MTSRQRRAASLFALMLACGAVLGACSDLPREMPESSEFDPREQRQRERSGTITGDENVISILGGDGPGKSADGTSGGVGIGVNAWLWRASLDTIDFMPLASADPFGGLIITDWYQPSTTPGERVKLHVLIKDTTLRADGVKVSVFRQQRDADGNWLDAPADPETARQLEDKILTRARELRIAADEG